MSDPTRPRLAVALVLCLIAGPVLAQGLIRVLSSWTGGDHPAVAVTLAAAAPTLLAGVVALVRGRPLPALGWLFGALAGAAVAATTGLVAASLAIAAVAGWLAGGGLPWLAERAPVPRGRVTAALWAVFATIAVIQVGRMSVFMADPTAVWGTMAPENPFMTRHSCLSSYVHGVALARRGDLNIYDDRYGADEDARPGALAPIVDIEPLTMDSYEYPPQFLLLPAVVVAVTGDFLAIRALWFLLTAAVIAWAGVGMARWLGGDAERRARLLVLVVGLSPPLLVTAYFGNFQLMTMALSALAMVWIAGGRTRRGAALLAFMIGAKLFPGILGIWLLAARRFAAAAWTAAFAGVYAVITLLWLGPRPFADFFEYHLPRLASGETFAFLTTPRASMSNLGVFGVPFKLRLAGWSGSEADAWALGRGLSWTWTLAIAGLAAYAGWRARRPETSEDRARLAGAWLGLLALAALRSPFAPPEAYIPLVWALSLRAAAAPRRRDVVVAVVLWIVTCVVLPVPSAPMAIAALVLQAVAYTTAIGLVVSGASRRL